MSFGIDKGILTINDPRGKYMGMQNIARNFLTNKNIDISCLGPAEKPTAIVLKLTPICGSKEVAMHMKADYFVNATPELFATLLSRAASRMEVDIMKGSNKTFNIYYNNGTGDYCTEDEFYNGTPDYTYKKRV